MQRYTATFLTGLIGGLALFASFNALVDPFGVTRAPDIPGLTERDTRLLEDGGRVHVADRLARGGDRSILLGSSRTVDGFPREPGNWPGGLYNAGMRGTNIFELGQAMALAARNEELRCVVIGLDLDEFGTHGKTKATYWLSALTDGQAALARARVSLSPSTFGAGVQLIADNLTGSEPRRPWADTYEPGWQRQRYESGARGIYSYYLGYQYDPERLAYFERVLDAVTASGVQVIGFIHPLHAWREEAMFQAGRAPDYFAFRRDIADLFERYSERQPVETCTDDVSGAVLWDFSGFQPLATQDAPAPDTTEAHPSFYEPSHYLPHMGQQLLDRIHSGGHAGDGNVDPLGLRLTPASATDSEAVIERRRADWLAGEDGQAAAALIQATIEGGATAEIQPPQFLNRDDWRSLEDKLERIAPADARR
ncbi:hypothetical protein [Maricaulis sp. CAU 1757]